MPRFFCPYCSRTFPTEAKRDTHIEAKQAAGKTSHMEVVNVDAMPGLTAEESAAVRGQIVRRAP